MKKTSLSPFKKSEDPGRMAWKQLAMKANSLEDIKDQDSDEEDSEQEERNTLSIVR